MFVLLLLVACKPDDTDAPVDTDVDTDAPGDTDDTDRTEETDSPVDTDLVDTGDPPPPRFVPNDDISVRWDRVDSGGRVRIEIVNSRADRFSIGMAETALGDAGWYGEDCSIGVCHEFSAMQGQLTYVESVGDVVAGSTTLFDGGTDGRGDAFTSAGADRFTYVIELTGGPLDGECYVWGDRPSYYSALGCRVL